MFYVLLGQITRCCANLFQDFSIFSCINLYFIVHVKIKRRIDFESVSPKSDAILVAINKRINTNSNEASWVSQWEAAQVLLHVWFYDFYEMGYFTE